MSVFLYVSILPNILNANISSIDMAQVTQEQNLYTSHHLCLSVNWLQNGYSILRLSFPYAREGNLFTFYFSGVPRAWFLSHLSVPPSGAWKPHTSVYLFPFLHIRPLEIQVMLTAIIPSLDRWTIFSSHVSPEFYIPIPCTSTRIARKLKSIQGSL